MSEPVETQPNSTGKGRPEFTDAQFAAWLDELQPYLKLGHSLNLSINEAGLFKHRDAVYEKARQRDWFSDKVKAYQANPGIMANNILVNRLSEINDKIKQGRPIDAEEMKDVRFMAEKHRSAQPYFVTRFETAEGTPIDDLLEKLDEEDTKDTVDDVAEQAEKQMVAAEPSLQDKK